MLIFKVLTFYFGWLHAFLIKIYFILLYIHIYTHTRVHVCTVQ